MSSPFDQKKLYEEAARDERELAARRKIEEERKKALKRTLLEQQVRDLEGKIRKQEAAAIIIKQELERLRLAKRREGARPAVMPGGGLTTLKTNLAKLDNEVRHLETEEHALQSKEVGLEREIHTKESATKVGGLGAVKGSAMRESQEVTALKQKEAQLQHKLMEEGNKVRTLEQNVSLAKREEEELARDLKEIERQEIKLRHDLKEKEIKVKELERGIFPEKQDEAALRRELMEVGRKEAEKGIKMKAAEHGAEAAKLLAARAAEVKAAEIAEKKKELDAVRKERGEQTKEIVALKKKLEEMRRELATAEREAAAAKAPTVDHAAGYKKFNREHDLQMADRELLESKQKLTQLHVSLQALK